LVNNSLQKLAIICTHPIQYNAPLFRLLHERSNISVKVFYTWSQLEKGVKFDPGFGKEIQWDVPLLDGYDYCFVKNVSTTPGSHHYKGINNPTLINEVQSWGANVIFIYGWSFKSHFKAMRFFYGKIPVLFRGDSTLLDEKRGLKKIVRKYFLKYVYSNINIAMYAGSANKDYFIAHGVKEKQLFFMPHAIDNNRFKESEFTQIKSLELRLALNIPTDALVFLFAGKLEPKKQPEFLADAFVNISEKNIYLIIAGNGELEKSLKNNYSKYEAVRFLEFQNQQQMPTLYTACDVFVLPSKGPAETWGLAINEAMAAGKAIIASDACGSSYDIVHNNKNGFVFEKNNKAALQTCLRFFCENRDTIKVMGEASMHIIKDYSYEKDLSSLQEVLFKISL
jgi:glycosyltransferase involved in cell wall biosynthesis